MAVSPSSLSHAHSAAQTNCSLCDLPIRIRVASDDGPEVFCCGGCRNVWRILQESGQIVPGTHIRELPLFIQARQMGLLGSTDQEGEPNVDVTLSTDYGRTSDTRQTILHIDGMWCASCAWLIGESLRRRKGVVTAEVSFATDSARVTYQPARLGTEELRETVLSLGYSASDGEEALSGSAQRAKRRRRELIRVGIAFMFAMNVMMLTPVIYAGQYEGESPLMAHFVAWLLFGLSIPVFVCAWPLFDRAVRAALRGTATMETLVTVGATAAFVYSVYQLLHHSARSYFDTADMLLGLVMVGKYIESNIRSNASDSIALLHTLLPKKATLLRGEKLIETPMAAAQLGSGDLIRVRAGETIAADGRVRSGSGSVDESLLTGESRPVQKSIGDIVTGGSLLQDGALDIQVDGAPSEGVLQQMASLVQESLHRKTANERVADRISRVFVPIVMALATVTGLMVYHLQHDLGAALTRTVAVLVIACPCALGIATPMAIMAGVAEAARRGILIGDPEALDLVSRLRRIIFDKTGTLTEGRFRVRGVYPEGASLVDVVGIERYSEHSIAKAIVAAAHLQSSELGDVVDFRRIEGSGITGVIDGSHIFAGNARLAHDLGVKIPATMIPVAESWAASGHTVIYFGSDGSVDGVLCLGDELRAEAAELVRRLLADGIECEIVSGDSRATVSAVAKVVGIDTWAGAALPVDKLEIVAQRIEAVRGKTNRAGTVAMVGDGVNDAPALARADVGIAMATGTEIAGKAAGVTLMSGRIERIADLIKISRSTSKVMRQNLYWAFSYNLVCIPLAIFGLITPIWAAAAMLVSSLTVLANTRRLAWRLGREVSN